MRLPTQGQCDMSDPEEHFLWALHQIPMGTQPMIVQQNIARAISKHLYECGYRHHSNLQEVKFKQPHRGQQHSANPMARWTKAADPDDVPVELPDVEQMTVHEQELMIQELKRVGRLKDPEPDRGVLARETSLDDLLARPDITPGTTE